MDVFNKCRQKLPSDKLIENNIYPFFHELQSRQGAEVVMEGKRRIMLGSNNYLGLTTHPRVVDAAIQAVKEYGSGCSGSRFLNGTLNLHVTLEKELADFLGKESALTFSTGFQSNLGIISAIAGKNDYMICDRENHASIYDGCKLSYGKMLRYRHNDMEQLEKLLKEVPDECGALIITDGVFSMSGDIANLPEICRLAKKYGAGVMVDDAHGFGVIGEGGRGTASHFGLTDQVDIIMGTFSKSLASMGGYMAAKADIVNYVKHTSRPFIFCASITPSNAAAALESLRVLRESPHLPKKLLSLAKYMREGLKKREIAIKTTPLKGSFNGDPEESITPIIPIYTFDAELTFVITKELYDAGVYVNPVTAPATPVGEALLRTSYMATLNEDLLEEALDIIEKVLAKYPLLKAGESA